MSRAPALALLLVALAAPLAAQDAPPPAGWHPLLTTEEGTVVTLDSATADRTGDSAFIVRTAVRFPRPVATAEGDSVDREVGTEELDCAGTRTRPLSSQVYAGEQLVRARMLSGEWEPVAPARQAVFDASCAYLLGGFAARLPRSYDLTEVDVQPELDNRRTVGAALRREYPPELRRMGQTGTVVVRFRVLPDGTVDPPSASAQEFTHPGFAQPAVRVVQAMRFRPARVRGVAVPVWVVLPVAFLF